jgi:hypothetical protein
MTGATSVLDEGIEDIEKMMEELRVEESRRRATSGPRELKRCHGQNFDHQASLLRRHGCTSERMSPSVVEPYIKDIREIALPITPPPPPQVEHNDDDERVHSANTFDVKHPDNMSWIVVILYHCFLLLINECELLALHDERLNAKDEDGGDVEGHGRADSGVQSAPVSRHRW